jgi:hypothetical protein
MEYTGRRGDDSNVPHCRYASIVRSIGPAESACPAQVVPPGAGSS